LNLQGRRYKDGWEEFVLSKVQGDLLEQLRGNVVSQVKASLQIVEEIACLK